MAETPDTERLWPDYWSTDRILPDGFLPMLATAASGPLDSANYGYEVRWEGMRLLAGLEGKSLILRNGVGQDAGFWLPELAGIRAAAEPDWVLLDGEIVVFQDGRPSPLRMQQRFQTADSASVEQLSRESPAIYMVYDVLRIGDSWLLDVNWEERRDILQRAIAPTSLVHLPPAVEDGRLALTRAAALGLEAVVAKRRRGRYFPGERTRDWLSIRPLEVVEAVICGWTEGRGARSETIGTLLLGAYEKEELVYIGHTGTGLDGETLRVLHGDLEAGAVSTPPFREVPALQGEPRWVRPERACRVRHQGWTEAGKMRAPTFVELAPGLAPRDCRLPDRMVKVGRR